MDTSITRISEFRAPPPYPKLAEFEEKPAQGMTPEKLDELDVIAARLFVGGSSAAWQKLAPNEKIYAALAGNAERLLSHMNLTIPEAIDRLGWVDASAMVARWSKRRG